MNVYHQRALQVKGDRGIYIDDTVITEETFRISINGVPVGQMVASSDQLRELGAGFVVCEGITDRVERVNVEGSEIQVYAPIHRIQHQGIGSSGGIECESEPRYVQSDLEIDPHQVYHITREIHSDIWQQTGGVHCSVLFCKGEAVAKSCDLGRHNTVDKVVGHAVFHGLDRSRCIIGCSGRQPAGMVTKVANAGIPIIISRAASTDRGIRVADQYGVTLICFSRGDRFTIYSHPERIRGIVVEEGNLAPH